MQSQTPLLMRALQRLRVPTLLFVNKTDRRGADCERVTQAIAERLTPAIVPMGSPSGTEFRNRLAEVLAERDEAILDAYIEDESIPYDRLRTELAAQTKRGVVHPVFFGSAITGAGVDVLMSGIAELLPAAVADAEGPPRGTVFKIERGPAGDRIAYVRMFSGALRVRDRLPVGEDERKVTAISVFDQGSAVQREVVSAREIGKVWGLGEIRIGDAIGASHAHAEHYFAPPTLETSIVPTRPGEKGALHAALTQLAEQDPLINLRQDDIRQELFLSLYGEVQKEVIQATLATDFGIDVDFRETTTICVERPVGTGAAVEELGRPNPFLATVGLRLEPAPLDTGMEFRLEVELGSMPLAFFRAVEETVRETLRQGIHGWRVIDCAVTMTHSGYSPPSSTAGDFRNLTPLVLMSALTEAGTVVCEPIHRFHLESPAVTIGHVLSALARLDAVPDQPTIRGSSCVIEGDIAAARVHQLRLELPGLTRGEGVLECEFGRYEPVTGTAPTRPRTDWNPAQPRGVHAARRATGLARRCRRRRGALPLP